MKCETKWVEIKDIPVEKKNRKADPVQKGKWRFRRLKEKI